MNKSTHFNWNLGQSPYTLWDRFRIASWILTQDQYTMANKVTEFEKVMSDLSGSHALMVANGSLANQLIFDLWKFKNAGCDPNDTVVICPAVTWISSITPAISLGFDIVFCDVNLNDLSFDYDYLEDLLKSERARKPRRNIIIWPTALIGFCPDMEHLHALAKKYGADLFLDACENTLSFLGWNQSILASASMVSTSCYASHEIVSVEGGFVFFRDEADYMVARLFRNHGLVRSLNATTCAGVRQAIERENPSVDPQFLFVVPGTNLRPSDIHAHFGLRDSRRADKYRIHRTELYRVWYNGLDRDKYYLPPLTESHVAFCLPIFTMDGEVISGKPSKTAVLKSQLNDLGIQTRPLIGGNLLRQPVFKSYGRYEEYPNAEWIHQRGMYIGLHSGITKNMVEELVEILNQW